MCNWNSRRKRERRERKVINDNQFQKLGEHINLLTGPKDLGDLDQNNLMITNHWKKTCKIDRRVID